MSPSFILNQPWDEILRLAALQGLIVRPVAGIPTPELPEDEEGNGDAGPDLGGAKARQIYRTRGRAAERVAALIVFDAAVERMLSENSPTELVELLDACEARELPLRRKRSAP